MPPYYYDNCVYVGYGITTLFLTSLVSAFGTLCAVYYTDIYPRQKLIVQLQNDIDLFIGEIDTVREESTDEYRRRRNVQDELEQAQRELRDAQYELDRNRQDLRVANRDIEIYTIFTYVVIAVSVFVAIYLYRGGLGTSDRTEL